MKADMALRVMPGYWPDDRGRVSLSLNPGYR